MYWERGGGWPDPPPASYGPPDPGATGTGKLFCLKTVEGEEGGGGPGGGGASHPPPMVVSRPNTSLVLGGAMGGWGVRERWLGGGGSRWGNLGVHAPKSMMMVNHRLPLPPLALPPTIPHPKPNPNLCSKPCQPC